MSRVAPKRIKQVIFVICLLTALFLLVTKLGTAWQLKPIAKERTFVDDQKEKGYESVDEDNVEDYDTAEATWPVQELDPIASPPLEALRVANLQLPKWEVDHSGGPMKEIEWVWMPPGKFLMGSPESEEGRRTIEGPQTEVTLTNEFWISAHEITSHQYYQTTGKLPKPTFPLPKLLSNHPAYVSWYQAVGFAEKLTESLMKTGMLPLDYVCRLPTEAEWEYACRAGTTTAFSFGDDPSHIYSHAWIDLNSQQQPQPIGLKMPNTWGVFGMHGNALEWTLDSLGKYPGGSITNPVGGTAGPWFAIRGGAWNHRVEHARSAFRIFVRFADQRGPSYVGFRVVIALPFSNLKTSPD